MVAINYYLVGATALTLVHVLIPTSEAAIEVTNEQLRDGLLSLVHSYSLLENKLDRHEQRERQLGEIIKRGLQTLTKGQKIFEPVRGSLSRLDERISQIETTLLNQDTKISEQQQKFEQTIASVAKLISSDSAPLGPRAGNDNTEKLNELSNQIGDLAVNVKELRTDVNDLAAKHAAANESTDQNSLHVQQSINTKLTSTEEFLTRFEEKLTQFYVTSSLGAPPTQAARDNQWEVNTTNDLQEIIRQIGTVKSATSEASDSHCVDKDFLHGVNNQTLEIIEEMRHEVLKISDKNFVKTTGNIKAIADKLEASVNELVKNDAESTTSAETFCESISANVRDVKRDLAELNKLEQMLVQMGDNVLSVKRGMEFNVHAITSEVSNTIKSNSKDLNTTINNKFDDINKTILSNHNGALANLTSKIETEISQVWRQIGIMYKEVSSSKDALNKLQDLTEAYVNGTFVTMDSMEGKVSQITGRMAEVDSNLNYLLGRLSLVTQEFNQIKHGLGSALDNIRSSFQLVQNQIQVVGPGPHKIENEEEEPEPDFNLLPQRDAPAATA